MNQECITIIVPVYNVENYLERCIVSICNQTYENLEIILVDDGATDSSPKICDEFAKKDSRIKVIHKENGGLSDARNAALEIATGAYIGFVDSDDYVHEKMFEVLYAGAKKYNAEITICKHYVEKGDKLYIEEPPFDEERVYSGKEALRLLIEDVQIRSYAWDKLYRADLFETVRFPKGRNYEDIAVSYLLFDKADQVCHLPDCLLYYQIREDSISYNDSQEKWWKNCGDMVAGMEERYEYLKNREMQEFAELSLSKMLPMILCYLNLCYVLNKEKNKEKYKQFLLEHMEEINGSKFVSEKDKKLAKLYSSGEHICKGYVHLQPHKKKLFFVKKVISKAKRQIPLRVGNEFDFQLKNGKKKRIILFETPCFDNLGDHAIAYAQEKFFTACVRKYEEYQIFRIKGWETLRAISQLRTVIQKEDIIVCQGGGNMGNLYMFAEAQRREIFRAFKENPIIVFPQTIFFTEDAEGEKQKKKSVEIYNRCKNLTILARDHYSYEKMKETFQVNIVEMVDAVTYLDASDMGSKQRDGVILCLRSDLESNLSTKDKKRLQAFCEKNFEKILITDTVTKIEIPEEEREKGLKEKWERFGKARMVITDRLHGMIFCLITKTPCIVLGNNHHKVLETYKTISACEYLYYAQSMDEAEALIKNVLEKPLPEQKTSFQSAFDELEQHIFNE